MPKAAAPALSIESDPRLELLGVVQCLAGRGVRAKDPLLEKRFGEFRDHPVVAEYRRRFRKDEGESYGLIALFLTPPPALAWTKERALLSGDFVERAGGAKALEEFLSALRDFAKVSDFPAFYTESAARLAAHRKLGERQVAGRDDLGFLETYTGERLNARCRVLWPLYYSSGELNSFIVPYPYQGPGRAVPGPFEIFVIPKPEDQEGRWPAYLWNEALCIPVERWFAAHDEEARALPPRARHFLTAALGWRLTLATFWRGSGAAGLKKIRAKAEPATWALVVRLEEYERDRKKFPNLDSFFPRLLDALRGEC